MQLVAGRHPRLEPLRWNVEPVALLAAVLAPGWNHGVVWSIAYFPAHALKLQAYAGVFGRQANRISAELNLTSTLGVGMGLPTRLTANKHWFNDADGSGLSLAGLVYTGGASP